MDHCLVTGGAGFIGSHLVRRLVAEGSRVRVLDNLSSGRLDRLSDVAAKIEFVEGDLRDKDRCAAVCKGVTTVFHQAALPSVPRSVDEPDLFHDVNVNGTFNMLHAAHQAGCRRFVYAASSAAYGDQPDLPKREDMLPSPLSPYALNKLVGEYYCSVFYESFGLETVSLRYFNVFGANQDPKSQYAAAIPAFVSSILNDVPPQIYGDGEQTRDFTYVDNVVDANVLAARASRVQGDVVNVAVGERISINTIIAQINALLGKSIQPEYGPVRAGDVKHSLADITRARELLGFEPKVNFETGLKRAIDWYKTL